MISSFVSTHYDQDQLNTLSKWLDIRRTINHGKWQDSARQLQEKDSKARRRRMQAELGPVPQYLEPGGGNRNENDTLLFEHQQVEECALRVMRFWTEL